MSHFKNVNVVYQHVTDFERAKKFYGEVLGWPTAYASDEVGWYEYGVDGQAHVAINHWRGPEPVPPQPGGTVLTLTVDDVRTTDAWLRSKGVRCDEVQEIPGVVTLGTFYDPEGNQIQFVSAAPPPA